MKPAETIRTHRSLCRLCASKAHDPCASCEHGQWGRYNRANCGEDSTPVVRTSGQIAPAEPSATRPGDMLARVIYKITGQQAGNCSCSKRQAQMNEWGWFGCWLHRKEIIRWLSEEAVRRGHPTGAGTLRSLFFAALKEAGGFHQPVVN